MSFSPPKDAHVITAAELNTMASPYMNPMGKPIYQFTGNTVINGSDLTGIEINVSDGGLWIKGDAQNFDAKIETRSQEKGRGIYIDGNVEGCNKIIAPEIEIGGDVIFEAVGDLFRGIISATRGDLRIKGNVTGDKMTRKDADDYYTGKKPGYGNPHEFLIFRVLGKIHAVRNVTVGGTAENVGIATQEGGRITTGAKKGWVVTKNPDTEYTIVNTPEAFKTPGPKLG